jgi:predicted nucleic acid-binding Zn finger protein
MKQRECTHTRPNRYIYEERNNNFIVVDSFVGMLSALFGQVMRGLSACDRIFTILEKKPIIDLNQGRILPHVEGLVG